MRIVVLAITLSILAGCAFQVPRYTVSSDNTALIRNAARHVSLNVREPTFKDDGSIVCRAAGAVGLPENGTFSKYIAGALISELESAKAYDKGASNVLEFQLLKADFSSRLGNTNWYIDAKYRIDGKEFDVSTVYHDRSSYVATKACDNVATYLPKAVALHINQVFAQPMLREALNLEKKADTDVAGRLKRLQDLLDQGLITDEEYAAQKKSILDSI